MLHSLYRAGLFAALFGLLFVPGSAWAQKDGRSRHVHDEAKLFGKEAIEQVDKTIAKIKKLHGKDLYIDTVEHGEKTKEARDKWAKTRFNDFAVDGIYIVVSKDPSFYRFVIGDNTREKGYFSKANIDKMDENLKSITKEGKRDQALIEAANYTLEVMNEHQRDKGAVAPPKKKAAADAPVANNHAKESPMPAWVGWVCLIIAVLLVVWIVFAIVRAMTSMGGGGYGYGGGYGGGGFFTGMLGGMFGAMAGMWLYNNMFGGHAYYGHDGQVNWGGDQGAAGAGAEPYQADTADGGTVGGGDDDAPAGGGGDDDAGGGDAGGGGGDWDAGGGGGEDAGGGGGGWFGGGGGDDGGGGGGGWFGGGDGGGGGGGDWGGGGGGDFGGGGGGGDW